MSEQLKWTFNDTDDGYWGHEIFGSREEAIEAAMEYAEQGDSMYIGKVCPINWRDIFFVDAGLHEECAYERLYNRLGEEPVDGWEKCGGDCC